MTPSISGEAPTLLIDDLMPAYDVREYHTIKISAPAGRVYRAVKGLDLCDSSLVRRAALKAVNRDAEARDCF